MLDTNVAFAQAADHISPHLGAEALSDVMDTLAAYPTESLEHALNGNQITCKRWLVDELHQALGGTFGTVYVLGGWFGVLPLLLLNDARFSIRRILSIDIDPACEPIASSLNRSGGNRQRFKALTANAGAQHYAVRDDTDSQRNVGSVPDPVPNLLINTSCEHMDPSERWYDRVPAGMLQALQSNDYFSCDEHVNCVESLEAFKSQVPMTEIRFAGTLPRRRYTRFMVIGRK